MVRSSPLGYYGYWWTASVYDASYSWCRIMRCDTANVYRWTNHPPYGFSVRLVRDVTGRGVGMEFTVDSSAIGRNGSVKIMKEASVVDYPRRSLPPMIWQDTEPPIMRPIIRKSIISNLTYIFERKGLVRPFRWMTGLYAVGSCTTNTWRDDSDLDVHVTYDLRLTRQSYPELAKLPDDAIQAYLEEVISTGNGRSIGKTPHTYAYMILNPGEQPISEAVYDVARNIWLKPAAYVPMTFNPDQVFGKQKQTAQMIAREIDITIGSTLRTIEDLKRVEEQERTGMLMGSRKQELVSDLKACCNMLLQWHKYIRFLFESPRHDGQPCPRYPAYRIGPNWEEKSIIFRFLWAMGYARPLEKLYNAMGSHDPYFRTVKQMLKE